MGVLCFALVGWRWGYWRYVRGVGIREVWAFDFISSFFFFSKIAACLCDACLDDSLVTKPGI